MITSSLQVIEGLKTYRQEEGQNNKNVGRKCGEYIRILSWFPEGTMALKKWKKDRNKT